MNLILNEHSEAVIQRVCDWANTHRLSMREVLRIMAPGQPPAALDPRCVCVVPVGYRCCFTIEQQKAGWCRHLTVACMGHEEAPSVPAVELLMREFGFTCELSWLSPNRPLHIDKEDIAPGKIAIGIWALLEEHEL